MPDTLDLTLIVGASGDTTPAEVQIMTHRLAEVLAERPDVAGIAPHMDAAPETAKSGGEVAALGALLLQVAPPAIEAVLGVVRDLLAWPGAVPTKVTVEYGSRKVAVEFDPSQTSADDVAALARTLTADLDPH